MHTVSSIEEGKAGSLTYLTNPKYEPFLYTTGRVDRPGEQFVSHLRSPVAATLVKVADAGACVLKLLEMYNAAKPRRRGISPRASVAEGADVGEECYIGDFAVVEAGRADRQGTARSTRRFTSARGTTVGDGTILYPGVKVYEGCTDRQPLHPPRRRGDRRRRLRIHAQRRRGASTRFPNWATW